MSTLDVLRAARALIRDPARWTQNFWAKDATGFDCAPDAPGAVCWCAAGAINNIAPGDLDAVQALDAVVPAEYSGYGTHPLFAYNDDRTHAEVLALFDAAIARLEREAQP